MTSRVRCKNGSRRYPEVQCGQMAKAAVINRRVGHPLWEGLDFKSDEKPKAKKPRKRTH